MDDAHFVEDLRARHNSGERLKYVFFWGHRISKQGITSSCFSQWYAASFCVDGQQYATAEHFMMAEKAALFGDFQARELVLKASEPGAAKAIGRTVKGFDNAVWVERRFEIVVRANSAKFAQNPELAEFLQGTGSRILVEASPLDTIWGIGLASDDERTKDPNSWLGLNLLGFALMHVRDCA
jgi:ribA/ribD-fused uncharacterized protein